MAAACLVLSGPAGDVAAADHAAVADRAERNVMVLLPADNVQAWRGGFQAALHAALERTLGDVRVLSQSADVNRVDDARYPERLRDWLAEKYRNTAFDLIVVPDTQALEYLDRHAPASWRGAPVVALHDAEFGPVPKAAAGITGFIVRRDFRPTVEEALALVPAARQIAIVAGAAHEERMRAAAAVRDLKDLPTIELVGLPMAELLERLRGLPADAIVLFIEMCLDGAGREFLGDRAFVEIARASARPVFGTAESLIGRGMVGGRMTDLERAGAALGALGGRVLAGDARAPVAFVHDDFARSLYDMRELKRWGLDARRLPLDAKLANHDESLIERYRWGVLAVIGALLLQALLIGALLVERERRRRAEGNARRSLGQLAHLDRVAAMGELATSLAHELNQPLAAILANAQAARRLLAGAEPDLHEVSASLDDIVDDDKRAGEVIRRMRTLLKKDEFRPEPVDLNEAANEVVRLLAQDAGRRGVLVELELAPGLPPVRGDTVQLQQVVLNLLVNAFEAVSRCAPERRRVCVRTREPLSGNVELTVEDSGDGIPEAHLEQLFEPFFTTKSDGLGMGLSITRSILELHGGEIAAQNLDGGGASFRCTLPRHGRAGATRRPREGGMSAGIVYVVDDDASMRRSVERLLRSFGHRVETYSSAQAFLEQPPVRDVGCLVLDLRMPGIDGLELQGRLAARGDELPVIFVSGHGDVPSSVRAMKAGAFDFLTKPFDANVFSAAVERALDWHAERLASRATLDALRARFYTLTPREREVCELVAEGRLNKQVAETLGTTEKTIKVHRARVMEKLGVRSVAELVRVVDRLRDARDHV